jgi:hypothetical protein
VHPACPGAIASVELPDGWTISCERPRYVYGYEGYADTWAQHLVVSPDLSSSKARVYYVARHEAAHAWCVEEGDYTEACANARS